MIARTEVPLQFRPRLLLAYADSAQAASSCRYFRRLGWEVHLTNTGAEARRLTRLLSPTVVLLDVDLADESGWLTCAKLILEWPQQTVILLSDVVKPADVEFARLTGAAAIAARTANLVDVVETLQQPCEEPVSQLV